jgi:hypothetical protein
MKYKVGDKVKIKDNEIVAGRREYAGKFLTIVCVNDGHGYYRVKENSEYFPESSIE